ncbi:MAG: hypothetical protein ABUK01_02950 [Leptospirales bacterium]
MNKNNIIMKKLTAVVLFAAVFVLTNCKPKYDEAEAKKIIKQDGLSINPVRAQMCQPPGDLPDTPTQTDMDNWALQLFAALIWPNTKGDRGVPDCNNAIIGQRSDGQYLPVVWETWKGPNEMFWPDGKKPASWADNGNPSLPPLCEAAVQEGKTLIYLDAKAAGVAPVDRYNQAVGYSVTAQNKTIIHYSITFDKNVYDYIMKTKGWNIENQKKMSAANFPHGSMEMKASWVVLNGSSASPDKSRFFTRESVVYTPELDDVPASCKVQNLGLIGLHFIRKVKANGRDQWIWATYEHVDNVPPWKSTTEPGKDPNHAGPYTLFNKDCYTTKDCKYNQSTEDGRPAYDPTEVIRVIDIGAEAKPLNVAWKELMLAFGKDNPWQYYELVETQWTRYIAVGDPGTIEPPSSANTTMETYLKEQDSSCVACHQTAKTKMRAIGADYSFMFAQACPDPKDFPWNNRWPVSASCKE